MMKEVVRALETGALGQISLIAFVFAFAIILIRVFALSKKDRSDAKNIPLNDGTEPFDATSSYQANGNGQR